MNFRPSKFPSKKAMFVHPVMLMARFLREVILEGDRYMELFYGFCSKVPHKTSTEKCLPIIFD